jgi:hypothetical protein
MKVKVILVTSVARIFTKVMHSRYGSLCKDMYVWDITHLKGIKKCVLLNFTEINKRQKYEKMEKIFPNLTHLPLLLVFVCTFICCVIFKAPTNTVSAEMSQSNRMCTLLHCIFINVIYCVHFSYKSYIPNILVIYFMHDNENYFKIGIQIAFAM